jgi:hypothetical protein
MESVHPRSGSPKKSVSSQIQTSILSLESMSDTCYIVFFKDFIDMKTTPGDEYKAYTVVQSNERAEDIAWDLQMDSKLAYVERGKFEIKEI